MDILPKMTHPPNYILLENVKGFEESDSRDLLVEALAASGYEFQELLITPLQIGIPNSRMRYYCLARKTEKVGSFVHPVTGTLIGYIPSLDVEQNETKEFVDGRKQGDLSGLSTPATKRRRTSISTTTLTKDGATSKPDEETILADPTLAHRVEALERFIEFKDTEDERMKKYMIPDKVLLKYGRLFDIVKQSTRRSCCFTKGKLIALRQEMAISLCIFYSPCRLLNRIPSLCRVHWIYFANDARERCKPYIATQLTLPAWSYLNRNLTSLLFTIDCYHFR